MDKMMAARIVTIADVYDALRMKRSYKPAFDHGTALEKIVRERGEHFDPELLDIFMEKNLEFDRIFSDNADRAAGPEDGAAPPEEVRTIA